jgi:hypothetical protein
LIGEGEEFEQRDDGMRGDERDEKSNWASSVVADTRRVRSLLHLIPYTDICITAMNEFRAYL